jgi:hypothetical protein
MKRWLLLAALPTVLFLAMSASAAPLFTKFNLHYYNRPSRGQDVLVASYANYVGDFPGHRFLRPNTAVEVGRWRGGFAVTVVETKEQILFEYHEDRMQMDATAYQSILFSTNQVSYADLSDVDQKGIDQGKALPGMTKEGVKIALGYPATHRTPSLDVNTWVYWRNRFATFSVTFDKGKVVKVGP